MKKGTKRCLGKVFRYFKFYENIANAIKTIGEIPLFFPIRYFVTVLIAGGIRQYKPLVILEAEGFWQVYSQDTGQPALHWLTAADQVRFAPAGYL